MREVKVGKIYRHFKGIFVTVIAVAKDSENCSLKVVYLHDGTYWVRPLDEFISEVDHVKYPNVKQKYRFEEMGDE